MKQLLLPPGRPWYRTRRFWAIIIGLLIVGLIFIIILQRGETSELSKAVNILDDNFDAIDQRMANVESGMEELYEGLKN